MIRPWRATYRLQLRAGMDFERARELLPYLRGLGISHLYLSPIFKARAGSTHGYDMVDPNEPDPALGGRAGFEALVAALGEHGLGLVLDIVPNHMAASTENPWWRAMLQDGPESPHAAWFDVDWQDEAGNFRPLALPILGDQLDAVLERRELTLAFDPERRAVELDCHGTRLPLASETLGRIDPELANLAARGDTQRVARLLAGVSAAKLRELVEAQPYRPAFWRDALQHLAYRRFFDVADLAGVRMEAPGVFEAAHRFIAGLLRADQVHGLRIDHVDGLAEPGAYLARLRELVANEGGPDRGVRIHVEKILGPDEELPADWPVDGTTGYEFLNTVLGVFVDPAGLARLGEIYAELTGDRRSFAEVAYDAKHQVLEELFPAEMERLVAAGLAAAEAAGQNVEGASFRQALIELITGFTVYRTYISAGQASAEDRRTLATALEHARAAKPELGELLDRLPSLITAPGDAAQRFAGRLQQLTGPVMAKALEDTAFYRWHRLIALNEVGGEPGHPPGGGAALHAFNCRRNDLFPASLLATSTHDTKRGEDVRARLAVLSELPGMWAEVARGWYVINAWLRSATQTGPAPDPRTEYLFYQTLVGAWPMGLRPDDASGLAELAGRIVEYLRKAGREAKERTFWIAPDEPFERGVERFVRGALTPSAENRFLAEVYALAQRVIPAGVVNSLAQLLVKLTSPGVPDLYQGTEFWDLSLVDPDNRRPVDFAARAALLDDPTPLVQLLGHYPDGRVKLAVTRRVLSWRAQQPALFLEGTYAPLTVEGAAADRVLAFARRLDGSAAITVVPRLIASWLGEEGRPIPDPNCWAGTTLLLPGDLWGQPLRCVLTDQGFTPERAGRLPLGALLTPFPVALLSA